MSQHIGDIDTIKSAQTNPQTKQVSNCLSVNLFLKLTIIPNYIR